MRIITNNYQQLNPVPPYEAQQLFTLISQGDHTAFTKLVNLYWKRLFSQSLIYVKDTHKAQDITQEVFLTLWNGRENLGSIVQPEHYMFTITKNKIISAFRKKLELPMHDILASTAIQEGANAEEKITYKRLEQLIQQAAEQMPPQRRQVFELSRKEGLTYNQIAAEMKISRETVKGHMVKALASVRSFLQVNGDLILILLFTEIFF